MGIRDSYSAQLQLKGVSQNSQSEFHFCNAHGGYPPHALMVTQQRMQGAPNVAPCMRLAEEVLSHFDLLCQSALTQKNGVCCFVCLDITVRCVGVARVAGIVMRTPTTRQ